MGIRNVIRTISAAFARPFRRSAIAGRSRSTAPGVRPGAGAAANQPDFEETRLFDRPERVDAWGRSREVDVSEEELDTLPAELQDHFPRQMRQ